MKININNAINEANISIHNVNQLFSFGDFICFGDFILLWATFEARQPPKVCARPMCKTLESYTTYMVAISNGSGYRADRELGALYIKRAFFTLA